MKILLVGLLLCRVALAQKSLDIPSQDEINDLLRKADEKVAIYEAAIKNAKPYLDRVDPNVVSNNWEATSTAHILIKKMGPQWGYCTMSVSFVVWARIVEPDVKLPVTTILYVLDAFPPPLLPPHADQVNTEDKRQQNANPLRTRQYTFLARPVELTNSHSQGKQANTSKTAPSLFVFGKLRRLARLMAVLLVVTVKVTDDGLEPLSVIEEAENAQVDPVGSPLQLSATV